MKDNVELCSPCPPVVLIGFKRPDTLRLVFEKVRMARPKRLFLVLDAPREGRQDDVEGWEKSKQIFEEVDWDCEVSRNYAETNMGCRDRIVSGLSWVFNQVDRAVILEDDCVPDITFFRFCAELLEKYKDDTRVGMIAGHDEHFHVNCLESHGDSYYFDRFASIWGWATWSRVWRLHDPSMKYWAEFRKRFYLMDGVFRNTRAQRNRMSYTDRLYSHEAGSWDGVWVTTMYKENMLCIHPFVNLVSNYGCDSSSRVDTPTKRMFYRPSPWDRRSTTPMRFPLKHPITLLPNIISERYRYLDSGDICPFYRRLWLMFRHSCMCVVRKCLARGA